MPDVEERFPDPPDIGELGNRNEEHDANDCGWSCPLHRGAARDAEMIRREILRVELKQQAQEIREELTRRVAALPRSEAASGAASGPDGTSLAGGYDLPNPIGETAEVSTPVEREPVRRLVSEHVYLSAHCVHSAHAECAAEFVPERIKTSRGVTQGVRTKTPSTCKHCDAKCICSCHCWRKQFEEFSAYAYCGFHGEAGDGWPCNIGWSIE